MPAMMLAVVEALNQIGGSANIQELDERVAENEGVTEEEQSYMMPNGRYRRFNYYLAWTRTFLKKGGAVDNSRRGVWTLTDKASALTNVKQMQRLYEDVTQQEKLRRAGKTDGDGKSHTAEPGATDDRLEDDADGDWKSELLQTLGKMDPSAFERLAQRLMREAGFTKVEVRGKSHDGGIDGLGILRVNLVTFQVYFQCKRWKGSVPSKEIRDFRGALQGRADKGLFITTGNFTSQAFDEATRDGAIAIDLIDGDRLCELLKEFDLGVSTELVEQITIDPAWFSEV